jgi:raffinose/stachyose/melibiose transport system substrate-binding protein
MTGMVQMKKRWLGALALGTAACLAMTGCSGSKTDASSAPPPKDPSSVSGPITVLTNRTDLNQDGTLKRYAAAFNKIYPKVKVTFQAITDYEGEVKTRMNTSSYGDVLLIPPSISPTDFPKFFASLGDAATLSKSYNWISNGTVDGTDSGNAYGIADFGNANGFVINKAVWAKAGVTSDPTTPAQYISDLQAIKAKTGAIPYYTNYHDGWPVQGWSGALGSATCSADANAEMATDKTPFAPGKDAGDIYSLLFNTVQDKLIEPDPTTTNWENSKSLLATGKVATMWLGSWAVTQFQAAATMAKVSPSNIGFMPYPAQKDGKFCSVTGPDYLQAISIHSTHKAAARAWVDWFTNKSGFATDQGSIPTQKGAALPSTLADFAKAGVTYIELQQTKAGTVSKIDNESEVGFFSSPNTAQHIVDVARGAAGGNLTGILNGLNKEWAAGIASVGG